MSSDLLRSKPTHAERPRNDSQSISVGCGNSDISNHPPVLSVIRQQLYLANSERPIGVVLALVHARRIDLMAGWPYSAPGFAFSHPSSSSNESLASMPYIIATVESSTMSPRKIASACVAFSV